MKKTPLPPKQHFIVPSSQKGMKLVHFLQEYVPQGSRELKRSLEQGYCRVNGKIERFASYRVQAKDEVQIQFSPEKSSQDLTLHFETQRVLYEDSALLFYDKPAGYPSTPTPDPKRFTLFHLLQKRYPSLGMVHRLDRDTSGILLFVKKTELIESVSLLFRNREIQKTYLALVDGRVEPPEGKIVSHLVLLGKETGWERWGSHPQGRGKYAETHYEVLQQWSKSAYVQLQPKTGRIHQLRIHFSEKQNPILGDHFYGKHFRCPYNPPRHLLHAKKLIMKHPISQKNLLIESPIPQDFQEAFHIFSGS